MKTLKISIAILLFTIAIPLRAQTADEIIANYFENTGGIDNWKNIEGMKMTAKVNQGGMEIPISIYRTKDGHQLVQFSLQGKKIVQIAFDGETLWGTNFQTMKAESKSAEDTENFKLNMNDFPDPFIDYQEKGYAVELLGKENIDGTETFKIKLIKEPIMVDGKKEDDISFYFFDTENFVPIAVQSEIKSGPGKGMIGESTFSDYQEVDGLYFPFSVSEGVKDGQSAPISFDSIEINPQLDEDMFKFPEEITEEKK